jgi:hypothetical protein
MGLFYTTLNEAHAAAKAAAKTEQPLSEAEAVMKAAMEAEELVVLDEDSFELISEMVGRDARSWWRKLGGGWFSMGKSPHLEQMKERAAAAKTPSDRNRMIAEIDDEIEATEAAIKDLLDHKTKQYTKTGALGFLTSIYGAWAAGGGTPAALGAWAGGAAGALPGMAVQAQGVGTGNLGKMVGGMAAGAAGGAAGAAAGAIAGAASRFKKLEDGMRKYIQSLRELKSEVLGKKKINEDEDYFGDVECFAGVLTEEGVAFLTEMVGSEAHRWWAKIGGGWFTVGKSDHLEELKGKAEAIKTADQKEQMLYKLEKEIRGVKEAIADLKRGSVAQLVKAGFGGMLGPVGALAGGGTGAALGGAYLGPVGAVVGTGVRQAQLEEGMRKFMAELVKLEAKVKSMSVSKASKINESVEEIAEELIEIDEESVITEDFLEVLTEDEQIHILAEMGIKEAQAWWARVDAGVFKHGEGSVVAKFRKRLEGLGTAAEKKALVVAIDNEIKEAEDALEDIKSGTMNTIVGTTVARGAAATVAGAAIGRMTGMGAIRGAKNIGGGFAAGTAVGAKLLFVRLKSGLDKYISLLKGIRAEATSARVASK